jgi:CarD family transcriptional regulator
MRPDEYEVGDTVVYPHHGAARIEAVETRTIKGEDRTYLVLKVDKGDLTVHVPADNAELLGVRDAIGPDGLERVFEVLRAPHTEEPTNFSRRYKANLEKLATGDVNKVAEVIRDLWRRDKERGLSAGEKRMLAKARQILVSELALAEKTNEDKAEALLDEVLAEEINEDKAEALLDEVLAEEINEDKANFKKRIAIAFARRQHRARRVARPAAGLLAVAARLLPAAERTRYAQEYLSELGELALSGSGRLRQLGYALRQLRYYPPPWSPGSACPRWQRRSSSPYWR